MAPSLLKFWRRIAPSDRAPSCLPLHFPLRAARCATAFWKFKTPPASARWSTLPDSFPPSHRNLVGLVSRPEELAAALDSGKSVLLCDSSAQSDLEALVRAAEELPGLLFAGSAGLAQALATRDARRIRHVPPPSAARTLIVAGSDHPVTKLQLETLHRVDSSAVQVLRTRYNSRDRARILNAFRTFAPQALILTGGDTALLAANTLGAHSFILHGELALGIPWGIVQGGRAEGCIVITKSGGFGAPTVFSDILNALRGPA